MIVNITAKLTKPTLPLDYRPALVSLLKSVLSRHYPEKYSNYYESGPTQKSFTFSVALKKPQFKKEQILLSESSLKISISSSEEMDVLLFYNAFQKSKGLEHPLADENVLTIDTVELQAVPSIYGSTAIIKFLSPLVVREHLRGSPDKYYVSGEGDFEACLKKIVSKQLGTEVELALTPIAPRKTVVTAFGTKIRASIGTFQIDAGPEVLNCLLRGGIGSRRSEGFGHFTVVGRQIGEQ